MAPNVDWDAILAADPEEIQESEDDALVADWCNKISEVDLGGVDDENKVQKAFILAQTLLSRKVMEADLYKEENEELVAKTNRSETIERQQHDEIRVLEQELAKRKRFADDGSGGGVDHTRIIRQELDACERELEMVKSELSEKERLVERERTSNDQYQQKIKDLEKECSRTEDLKRENERQRSDINEYIQRLKNLTDAGVGKHHDDLHLREKLQAKSKELLDLNDEYLNLVTHNQQLEEKQRVMEDKMNSATMDMNRITEDYLKQKAVLKDNDAVLDSLKRENERLKMQVQDMTDQVKSKGDTEDEIMVAVNNKVEEWKKLLAKKDEQLLEYREQVLQQKEQLVAMSMDSERAKMSALERGVEERDVQIRELQEKLQIATDDIDQTNALMEDLRAQVNKEFSGPGATDVHIRKVKELQGVIRDNSTQARITEDRLVQAEQDAREKDKQLNELLEKLRGYENKVTGLPEAVQEIKDCKLQIQIRDRQIVELTQNVNALGNQMNDLADENDELRERLGLDPKDTIDLTDYRNRKIVKQEEERAVNQVLQKEVEKLEDERLELKQQIRKLAQTGGQRAVALGLTTDDVTAIEEFTETLKKKRSPYDVSQLKKDAETDELKSRALQLAQETEKYQKDVDRIRQTNAELNLRIKEVDAENKKLEQGLKEVLQSVKESKADGTQSVNIESPTLERMLAAIEAKQITGSYDAALHLKAQVDNLTGRNDELRRELREARVEGNKAKLELERATSKVAKLEEDLNVVRVAGGMGMLFQTLTLPEGMAVSSADVIASLNEHLVQTLHELNQREAMLGKMEEGLESYKGKFAVVRHQLGLVYKQFHEERLEWDKDRERLNKKMVELEGTMSEDKVKVQEFDRLLETLGQDDSEVRRRLADMSRKATVLRVNEKALTRRYAMMQDVENSLRKENTRLKNEVIAMETAVTERLGYLQRYKDMASFKIATLQKTREESVPIGELEAANKQYQELTEKYRDLLDRSNNMIAKNEHSATLEMEQKRLQYERDGLAKELEVEKEKTHAYQSSFEQLQRQGIHMTGPLDNEAMTQAKKLATLEMKEINERQRADHAVRMYEQRKEMISELENRNSELEQKFAELTRMNLDAQRTERQLRDELSNCVLKSVSDADRDRIANLEASENALKIESSRLKEIADVAVNQASAMEQQKVSQEKELISLRQQLIDIQAQSDEKKVIGKLHRHIVQLQVSEGTAVKKLEDSLKKITKLQAQMLRLEQRLDEKDQTLLHHRAESANKSRHLRRTIHELRRMFSGAIPLSKQERFAKAMAQLQEDKESFAQQLKQVTDDRVAVEDKLACLKVQYSSLQELISTLKDGKGANKIVEWHGKMEELRLEELKKTRQIQRLSDQVSFMQGTVRQHEVTISNLEEEQVKMNRHYEERQLQWEQREMEMERIINKLENQQQEIAGAASKFEEATGTLPDITLPISDQLEQAIATIKNNVRVIIETQTESRSLKSKLADLEVRLKEADANLLSRDRLIAELRLRMPATAERDAAIAKATANSQYQEEQYETKQALRVAQSTIGSLQARITQKEETISKLQNLLQQARDEMLDLCNKHDTDMKLMVDRLHIKSDDAFVKFKQTAISNVNQPPPGAPTSKQLSRLNELEDVVSQQDNQIAALSERIRSLQVEVEKWRQREEHTTVTMSKEKERLIEEHHVLVQKLDSEIDDLKAKLAANGDHVTQLHADLKHEREMANRGPTAAAKEHMNRLKEQIQEKDEELQRMTTALRELRADLVQQAEEAVKVNASNAAQDWNIQKLIDKRTKELKGRIDELETALEKTKGDGRRRLDKEASLHIDNEELKDELARKEAAINRLKTGKRKLEEDVETLERRLERQSSHKRLAGKEEVETLRIRVKTLEQQLSESKMKLNRAEKPSEDMIKQTFAGKQGGAVERWEETKKQQKQLEKVKGKLVASEVECEKLRANNDMMKNALDRVTKAKEALEKKAYKNAPPMGVGKASSLTEQELRNQNEQLQNEISDLRQQLLMTRDVAYEEVQLRNRQLADKLEQMEAFIQKKARDKSMEDDKYPDLVAREQKLQNDVLKLSEENLSLRFEVTQLQQEVPRLKEKVQSQKMYIEAMKADRERDTAGSVRSLGSWVSSGNSQASMIRKIGESGRSPKDLEKTISLLKKVVEKKQAEIERLKMAPGVVSNEQFVNLERENAGLRDQLEELRSKMGATLTERYEMKDKSTKRLTHDFEKLRKDLKKEQESSEKLQVALNSARLTAEQHAKTIEELRGQMAKTEATTGSAAMDQKAWKATAITRMSEEKASRLAAELDSKATAALHVARSEMTAVYQNKALTDMKALLRDSATREKELMNDREELERKISILERFPPGAKLTDSEVMAQLQQAKLVNQRLQDEKAELLNELRKFKGHSAADDYDDNMVEKARKYDSALRDQADLSTKLTTLEQEKEKIKVENEKLKRELAHFGPEFFEEIEDLKYNYQESEIRNAQLEEKLAEVCRQFGVSL